MTQWPAGSSRARWPPPHPAARARSGPRRPPPAPSCHGTCPRRRRRSAAPRPPWTPRPGCRRWACPRWPSRGGPAPRRGTPPARRSGAAAGPGPRVRRHATPERRPRPDRRLRPPRARPGGDLRHGPLRRRVDHPDHVVGTRGGARTGRDERVEQAHVGVLLGMPLHTDGEARPGISRASTTPSAPRALTSSPSPTRSTAWWCEHGTVALSPMTSDTTEPGSVTMSTAGEKPLRRLVGVAARDVGKMLHERSPQMDVQRAACPGRWRAAAGPPPGRG